MRMISWVEAYKVLKGVEPKATETDFICSENGCSIKRADGKLLKLDEAVLCSQCRTFLLPQSYRK